MNSLPQKIKQKNARVVVIGLGYVGLPLALTIEKSGFAVTGLDTDSKKIAALKKGQSYIDDIKNEEVGAALSRGRFTPTADTSVIKNADICIIAVPTPLDAHKIPNLSPVISAAQTIAHYAHKNQLVVLESTTYPGTTDEVLLPLIQKALPKATVGEDFFIAFSPERVDPGNKHFTTATTPKIVGGVTPACTTHAALFYSQFITTVVPVSSAKVAEMTKLLENIFRIVNISLVNELALFADKAGIDIWEVISAASTKPYGFMPFYPGPGVGGHCIAVDPFYLSYKAREYGFFTRFIDLAGEINEMMPHYVVTKIATALNYTLAKAINKSRILILGVAYKKDIQDTRESAAYPIVEMLTQKGARISYYDDYCDSFTTKDGHSLLRLTHLTQKALNRFDAVVILTDHSNVDYTMVAQHAAVVVDTRNVISTRRYKNVYHL